MKSTIWVCCVLKDTWPGVTCVTCREGSGKALGSVFVPWCPLQGFLTVWQQTGKPWCGCGCPWHLFTQSSSPLSAHWALSLFCKLGDADNVPFTVLYSWHSWLLAGLSALQHSRLLGWAPCEHLLCSLGLERASLHHQGQLSRSLKHINWDFSALHGTACCELSSSCPGQGRSSSRELLSVPALQVQLAQECSQAPSVPSQLCSPTALLHSGQGAPSCPPAGTQLSPKGWADLLKSRLKMVEAGGYL